MTQTVEIELPLLLPQVKDGRDQCVERLRELLLQRKGIREAHLEDEAGQARLCFHFDPRVLSVAQVERLAEEAGAEVTQRYRHQDVRITDMDCADCASSIEHVVGRLPGIVSVNVSYAAERMRVEYDSRELGRDQILERVQALGYQVAREHAEGWLAHHRELLMSLGSGLCLATAWLGETLFGLPRVLALPLYIATYGLGGFDVARHGLGAARQLRFDIDFLMVVAALGAAALGNWPEGALLLFLFSLGHALEHYAMGRARSAIRELGQLTPKTALVRRAGQEVEAPVEEVLRGDLVVVRPGERIPVDGLIRSGRAAIDQSPVTGESMPVDKGQGDEVFAGTVNGATSLEVEVTRLAGETVLARVAAMVQEAEVGKAPSQRTSERFTRAFVPAVLAAAGLLIVIPPLLLDSPLAVSFLRAMALLVAASPCALGLATPSAVLSGLAQAARRGVLVKGGAHLENLAGVRAIAFDKTGTLTRGRPELVYLGCMDCLAEDGHPRGVEAVAHCPGCRHLLEVAAAVESRSGHPLARAIVSAAREAGLKVGRAEAVEALTGRGLSARRDGKRVLIGSEKLFDAVPEPLGRRAGGLEAEGRTAMLVREEEAFLGAIGLGDEPRPEAEETIRALRRLGIQRTILITGDNERTAAATARRLGIDEYRADLLPEEKVAAIRELLAQHGSVAMVGDGVNDAPALANATVGIAMGGAGSDVALETADVALMADNLGQLPFLVGLARASRRKIRQNLALSLGVIALLAPAAVLGLASIGQAILLHEGSTLAVVFNALRLLRFRG